MCVRGLVPFAPALVLVAALLLGGCGELGAAGGSNCGPLTLKPGPGVSLLETHGITNTGDAWMLVAEYPVPSGRDVEAYFKLTDAAGEAVSVRVEGVGFEPPATVEAVEPHTTAGWQRPGKEWLVRLKVPRTGCWSVRFDGPPVQGSFTLRVK